MLKLLCLFFGHRWNVIHVGDNMKSTPVGSCIRCGKRPAIDNAITRCSRELATFAKRMEREKRH